MGQWTVFPAGISGCAMDYFRSGSTSAVVLNVDTIYIANTLLYDIPLRTSLVAAAQEYAKGDAATSETVEVVASFTLGRTAPNLGIERRVKINGLS